MPEEEEHAVPQQTRRRLVAGQEEEHAGGEHLSYRGLPPRIVGRQERRDEIVAGLALAFPDDPREIVGQPPHVPRCHLRPSRHVSAGRQHRQVGFREAEEAHHHSPRDRIGEVLHEVEAGETGNAIDLFVGERCDPRFERPDGCTGKRLGHEAAEAAVIGRVLCQHRVAEHTGLHRPVGHQGIAEQGRDLIMAGDDPCPVRRRVERARLREPALVGRVGIVVKRRRCGGDWIDESRRLPHGRKMEQAAAPGGITAPSASRPDPEDRPTRSIGRSDAPFAA